MKVTREEEQVDALIHNVDPYRATGQIRGHYGEAHLPETTATWMAPRTRTQQLLSSLRESIVDKPPYISGTLKLPESHFSLFYKEAKDSHDARFEDSLMSQS